MGWDASKPGTSEKIRNLSSVITANWDAIEQGPDAGGTALEYHSIQLGNRTSIAAANDPTTDAGIFYHYAKDDGAGNQEWFTRAPDGAIVQMSKGDVTVGAEGSTYLPGGVILKWGNTSVAASTNTTTTFAAAFPNAIYSVNATPIFNMDTTDNLGYLNATATTADFVWRNPTGQTYTIYWVAIGS